MAGRQGKEAVLQLPAGFAGDTVYAWMSYVNNKGDMVSTSIYPGEIGVV